MSKQVQDSKNDEELVEAIARRITRDRYRYCLDGSPLSDEWRDKYAENSWHEFVDQAKSALAVAKPEIEALRNTILDQLAYHEMAQAENASLKEEIAKLRQRLVIRENLRERIAQLNTQLAIARAGSTHLKEK